MGLYCLQYSMTISLNSFACRWARFLRQSVLLSSQPSAELTGLFNRNCHNVKRHLISRTSGQNGVLMAAARAPKQVFHRVASTSLASSHDDKLEYFTTKLLPSLIKGEVPRTVLFCRSYFEFVQLRNLLRRKEASFCTLSEYTSHKAVSRNSQWWSTEKRRILLITERFHFFKRAPIRKINQLVVYSLPEYAQFYAEYLNNFAPSGDEAQSSVVLYNKYDWYQIERTVGHERAQQMLVADSSTHMFC